MKAALAGMRARCEAAQKVQPKLLAHQLAIADLPKLIAVAEAVLAADYMPAEVDAALAALGEP